MSTSSWCSPPISSCNEEDRRDQRHRVEVVIAGFCPAVNQRVGSFVRV
jgi:hypothetical protein